MTYRESYKKLRNLYSEKAVSYDSLNKGKEIENLVSSLMREIANPLALITSVRIGNSEFDGEIRNGNRETILYDVLVGRLSKFRFRSLSNLVKSTNFTEKTYILVIVRSFSYHDRKSIADLTSEIERYRVRFAFISHRDLIVLHKFCVKMNARFKGVELRKIKRLFLELILGSEQIVEHRSFAKYLNLAVERAAHEPMQEVVFGFPPLDTRARDVEIYQQIQQLASMVEELNSRMRKLRDSVGTFGTEVMLREEEISEIDLREIEGSGDFPCPRCGNILSPEDESEQNYRITETEFADDRLSALTLICSNCKTKIRIVGFPFEPPIKGSKRNIKRIHPTGDESRRSIQAYLRSMR